MKKENAEIIKNISVGAETLDVYGEKFKKQVEKISDSNKGVNNAKAKKVNQYSLDGVLIKTWDYIKQATKILGIPYQNISRCCRTGNGTAGGFKWSYVNED